MISALAMKETLRAFDGALAIFTSKNELEVVRSCPERKLADEAERRSSANEKAVHDVATVPLPALTTNWSALEVVGAVPVAVYE